MKVTQEQIQQIESYLDRKKLNYIDVRLEILDHIITDIENIIETKNISFENAYKKVTTKWNEQLEPTSSLITGYAFTKPKVVTEKMKKVYLFWFICVFGLAMLTPFVIVSDVEFIFVNAFVKWAVLISLICCVTLQLALYFLMRKTKEETTFSHLYKTQVLPSIYLILPHILIMGYEKNTLKISLLFVLLNFIYVILFVFGFKLYKKHLKSVSIWKFQF